MKKKTKNSRILIFNTDVEEESIKALLDKVLELDKESNMPITILINSLGGDSHQAVGAYNVLKMLKSELITIIIGACESAAVDLFLAGDKRGALPNTTFMIHSPYNRTEASFADSTYHKMSLNELERIENYCANMLASFSSSMTPRQWKNKMKHTTYLSGEELIKYGLANYDVDEGDIS